MSAGPPHQDPIPPPPVAMPPGPPQGAPSGPPPPMTALTPMAPPVAAGGVYYDPGSRLMLPNGTALAGVGRRIGAYFLAIPLFIVTLGVGYLVWGVIVWARGQTPTYQVLGMRCWRPESGRVPGWGWMALRELVGRLIVESLTITALVSFILFLATDQRRTLHDYIAGTVVLHDPNKALG
ncbi:MAG TPA: RDD family protein [Candidatus Dormibacteraeota bacterium]